MKMKTAGLVVAIVILSVIILAWFLGYQSYENSLTHSYSYDVTLDFSGPVTNATFILPLSFSPDSSAIIDEIAAGNISGLPEDWQISILTAEDNTMLKIFAREIEPYHQIQQPIEPESGGMDLATPLPNMDGIYKIPIFLRVSITVPHEINTVDPIGNEPLLYPKYGITDSECDFPHPERSELTCSEYLSRIFANYSAPAGTDVEISIRTEGRNSWWVGGWSGNSYHDRVLVQVTEGEQGWLDAGGFLVAGEGRYSWL